MARRVARVINFPHLKQLFWVFSRVSVTPARALVTSKDRSASKDMGGGASKDGAHLVDGNIMFRPILGEAKVVPLKEVAAKAKKKNCQVKIAWGTCEDFEEGPMDGGITIGRRTVLGCYNRNQLPHLAKFIKQKGLVDEAKGKVDGMDLTGYEVDGEPKGDDVKKALHAALDMQAVEQIDTTAGRRQSSVMANPPPAQ